MLVMPVKGGQGPAGAPGGGFRVFREIPVGVKDGVNTTYTTANPFQPGTLMAYRNGLVEFESAESGDQAVVFSDPPEDTDHIYVDYTV